MFDIQEVVKPTVVKASARQQYQSQAVKQKVAGGETRNVRGGGTAPSKIKNNLVYHGTTQPASQSISKSGWRTDKNVSRQMSGNGVYVTPQKPAAQMYANQRSNQRGEKPAVRTLSIPSSKYQAVKAQRQSTGQWNANKGGQKFNFMQMSPQGANKYDITNKPRGQTIRPQGSQKAEIKQRVKAGLQRPANVKALKTQLGLKPKVGSNLPSNVTLGTTPKGGGNSAPDVTDDPNSKPIAARSRDYKIGGGTRYGISGIGLADSYDLYDIVLSHLLDEGYAETQEAAEAIMVNMSEDWRESICEAEIEPPKERVGALMNIDIPMSEREAARQRTLAKAKEKREKRKIE